MGAGLKNVDSSTAQVLTALNFEVTEWKKRMEAAQNLARYYKDSPFAKDVISVREKEFKKKYWNACQQITRFKKSVLGE